MPRRQVCKRDGARPLVRPLAHNQLGAARTKGAAHFSEKPRNGEAEPRLTSGGEAVTTRHVALVQSCVRPKSRQLLALLKTSRGPRTGTRAGHRSRTRRPPCSRVLQNSTNAKISDCPDRYCQAPTRS